MGAASHAMAQAMAASASTAGAAASVAANADGGSDAAPRRGRPAPKSLLRESRQIERAVQLIELGARLQVLESETDLSYERLLRLYKEVAGRSPSKGQLPFSTDWFLTWQPNIHASLFMNLHEYMAKTSALEDIDIIIKSYRLYTEQMGACGVEPLLSVTRAWRLVRFMDNQMLSMTRCSHCGGHFVTEPYENERSFVCGLCEPPARAGRSSQDGSIHVQ